MSKITDYSEQVISHYETGKNRGDEIGFKCLNELITFKPKYSTYILGYPRSGKTEFHLEILFNLTEKYGYRHAIMSPEIGGMEDIIAELVSKHLKKQFYKSSYNAPTEREVRSALSYLSEYFYVLDCDSQEYTVDSYYDECLKIERDNQIKLNTTSIDPWNDLDEDLQKYGGREDKYLAAALRKVRATAKKNNWHNFIITHAKEMPLIELKSVDGGKSKVICTAIPTLQGFAGGQVWSRRAFNVIGMWRPEKGAINSKTGVPFEDNEAMVKILKVKPKGVGSLGTAYMFFDWKTNRYYEKVGDVKCFSDEWKNLPPEIPFLMPESLVDKKEIVITSSDGEPLPF